MLFPKTSCSERYSVSILMILEPSKERSGPCQCHQGWSDSGWADHLTFAFTLRSITFSPHSLGSFSHINQVREEERLPKQKAGIQIVAVSSDTILAIENSKTAPKGHQNQLTNSTQRQGTKSTHRVRSVPGGQSRLSKTQTKQAKATPKENI